MVRIPKLPMYPERNLMEIRMYFELDDNENMAYQNCGMLLKLYLEGR